MVSALPVSSVGTSGDPAWVGLDSEPGIWAGVESVGAMEGSGVGEGPGDPCVCTPGEPCRRMEGPSLQFCHHLLCTHVRAHTNTSVRNQSTMHAYAYTYRPTDTLSILSPLRHIVHKTPHTCTHVNRHVTP